MWKNIVIGALALTLLELKWAKGDPAAHPLDPLTPDEITATVHIINAFRPDIELDGWWYNYITLKEPTKSELLPYYLDDKMPPFTSPRIPRRAFVVLHENTENIINEVVVNLHTRRVESWTEIPRGTDISIQAAERDLATKIVKSDPRVIERCHQMGWTDMNLVVALIMHVAYGADKPLLKNAVRPRYFQFYGQLFEGDHFAAHPFDFMVAVDVAKGRVISIDNLPTHEGYDANDRRGNVCPTAQANYNPKFLPSSFYRKDLHPIHFSQPGGASYTIRGNEVSWQKFKFRLGFNGREGVVINQVSYQDQKEEKPTPLFYRLSLAELFVPYADARPIFHQKMYFDLGEFGMGVSAIDHKEAGICRGGEVFYFSFYVNDEQGRPVLRPNAVCIFEEDAGILWTRRDRSTNTVVHTRSTRLVVACMASLNNYDYRVSWRFYQDASIEFNTDFNGNPMTNMLAQNVTHGAGFGTTVFPQVEAQFHQHNLAIRIDPEIGGNLNYVAMSDVVPLSEPTGSAANPYGNGFTTVEKILTTPLNARTNTNSPTARTWSIKNPAKIHPYTKKPVSYKLHPFAGPATFVKRDSPLHPRGAFADYNVWVTKYKDDQFYPGGFYINATGLPQWVNEEPNVDLTNTDVVLWFNYGLSHIVRVEDWPVMPVEYTGFFLKPTNFFLQNPALDVPPPPPQ